MCEAEQDLCMLPWQIPALQKKGSFVTPGLITFVQSIQTSLPVTGAVLRPRDLAAGGPAELLAAMERRLS